MADKLITALPSAHGLDGTESFHGNQGIDSREMTVDQIATFILGKQLETKVTMSVDQSVTDANETNVLWNTETRDEGAWHDTGSLTDRITTGAGIFDAVAKIRLITMASSSTFEIRIGRYNSSDVLQEYVAEYASSNEATQDPDITVTALNVRMTTGDFIRVTVQSSDTTYSVESDDSYFMVRSAALLPGKTQFIGCRVYQSSSNTGITSATSQFMNFQQEQFDTDDMHDNSVNNDRVTVQTAGYYVFAAQLQVVNADNYEFLACGITKEPGTVAVARQEFIFDPSGTGLNPTISCSTGPIFMEVGDYVKASARLIPTDDSATGIGGTWLSAMKVDPLVPADPANLFSGARAYHTAGTTITATSTEIPMGAEDYDTDSYHDNSTNPARLIVPVTGFYEATGQVIFDTIDNAIFNSLQIRVDGTLGVSKTQSTQTNASNTFLAMNISTGPIFLQAGQYVSLWAAISPTLDLATGIDNTSLSIQLVGRPSGGTGAQLFEDLLDVDFVTNPPVVGSLLVFDGTKWGPKGDDDFSKVVLLLSMDGADMATTAIDDSNSGHSFTFNADAELITAQQKFGTASLDLDGTGDYLSLSDDADFEFGSFDFTMEFWTRSTNEPSNNEIYLAKWDTGGNICFIIQVNHTANEMQGYISNDGSGIFQAAFALDSDGVTSAQFYSGDWYHVAFVRQGAALRIYVNGLLGNVVAATTTSVFVDGTNDITIGSSHGGNGYVLGGIDELRITRGIARYTGASFTPPTLPFPRY